jgi:hypothetical protein
MVLACLALAGLPAAQAHHAFAAEYDGDKPLDLSGTVTKADPAQENRCRYPGILISLNEVRWVQSLA